MKTEIQAIAASLYVFAAEYDTYEHMDSPPDLHEIAADLAAGNTESYIAFLTEAMEETEIEEERQQAAKLIRALSKL